MFSILLLFALPLAAQTSKVDKVYQTEWDNVLPQIADGGGWTTRIILINMGSQSATAKLYFYKDDGSEWAIRLKGQDVESPVWNVSLPVGGSLWLETPGTDAQSHQGWMYMETSNWISGMAMFIADWPGVYAEGVVPFTPENDFDFYIPFDNRNGYVTSLALVNPYLKETATLKIDFLQADGTLIVSRTITLKPLEHIAFESIRPDMFPETIGHHGVIHFQEVGGQAGVSSLGLLFSPRGPFTSMHAVSIDPHYYY